MRTAKVKLMSWGIVVGMLLGWDLVKNIHHFGRQRHALTVLEKKIAHAEPINREVLPIRSGNSEEMLQSFLDQARLAGLIITSATYEKIGTMWKLHFEAQGNFAKIKYFFNGLQHCPFEIHHVEIKAQDWTLKTSADLGLLGKCNEESYGAVNKALNSSIDPFALAQEPEKIPAFPVKTLQMAGYIKYAQRMNAIILLPNGQAIEVAVNDLVGREKSRVMSVSEHAVGIILQGKKWEIKKK